LIEHRRRNESIKAAPLLGAAFLQTSRSAEMRMKNIRAEHNLNE